MGSRNCVITGVSSGIGKTMAEILAGSGYHVFGIARPSGRFEEAIGFWGSSQLSITPIPADIADPEHVAGAFRQISAMTESIDLLINNAGHYFTEDCDLPSMETMRANIEVNFLGHFNMISTFLPLLEKSSLARTATDDEASSMETSASGWPTIINVTSGAGGFAQCNSQGPLAYRTSKAAMNMVTRSLHHLLAPKGIAIHAVDPGWVKTRLNPAGTDTPENSAMFILRLLTISPNEGGRFWYYGQPAAW
ncbi:MAG: hypothetical protein CVV64_12235 [Candidatus Wallbacteria bacterium HGW-Wallbacteria-1]|jgi:NAD(P)-dependent dehydrogenase (short-subunit alcohol dehydrogenase family)|uniref:Short-chain dehydrogenase n=1 Tax=Candidatus Wallbacteria bacterium HGW-Wallbacteria-1 TaxID=2013854 RepID=A0A2N1PNI6_9BACT|nr:MAG: hypothetical protein CVV64_12235 [Candidatus Wallbacteria bacterium HGW-Wallbacteria-1]